MASVLTVEHLEVHGEHPRGLTRERNSFGEWAENHRRTAHLSPFPRIMTSFWVGGIPGYRVLDSCEWVIFATNCSVAECFSEKSR